MKRKNLLLVAALWLAVSGTGLPALTDVVYHLDTNHCSVSQTVAVPTGVDAQSYKFVRVTILQAVNPRRVPILFDVSVAQKGKEPARLGRFGLYPADNPGVFLISTRHQVKAGDELSIRLQFPDSKTADEDVAVTLQRLELVDK